MLSLFYKILEIKIGKELNVMTFKPSKKDQIILIKSELGQFKLKWDCSKNILNESELLIQPITGKNQNNDEGEKKKPLNIISEINSIWIKNFLNEMNLWTFKNENKHFIYNKNLKIINDKIYIKNEEKEEEKHEKKKQIFEKLTKRNEKKDRNKNNTLYLGYMLTLQNFQNNASNTISEGEINNKKNIQDQIIPLLRGKILETRKQIEEKINKQIKNIIIGLTQGFTINLELNGIGYQAKINELNENELKGGIDNKEPKEKGQLEWNIKELKKYIMNEKNEFKNHKITEFDIKQKLKTKRDKEITTNQLINKKMNKLTEINKKINQIKEIKKELILRLGTSHNIKYSLNNQEIDTKITISPQNMTNISIYSISYDRTKQIAAQIFLFRKPEPYHGKGIRYNDEKFFPKEMKKKN